MPRRYGSTSREPRIGAVIQHTLSLCVPDLCKDLVWSSLRLDAMDRVPANRVSVLCSSTSSLSRVADPHKSLLASPLRLDAMDRLPATEVLVTTPWRPSCTHRVRLPFVDLAPILTKRRPYIQQRSHLPHTLLAVRTHRPSSRHSVDAMDRRPATGVSSSTPWPQSGTYAYLR